MALLASHPLDEDLPWAILLAGSGSLGDQALMVLHDSVRDDARILGRMEEFAMSGENIDDRLTILDEDTILHAAQRGEAAAHELHEPSAAVVAAIRDVYLLDSSPISLSYSVVALILEFLVAPAASARLA
jgi:hypothetical protein